MVVPDEVTLLDVTLLDDPTGSASLTYISGLKLLCTTLPLWFIIYILWMYMHAHVQYNLYSETTQGK